MINKFTLRFEDKKIEESYQEYQTKTNRKPLLLRIFFTALVINLTDFISAILKDNFEWVTPELILTSYLPYLAFGSISLIIIFCKPQYCRWALLIQSHLFAYSYYSQEFPSIEQYKFYTFAIIGTQFLIFMTGEFIEVFYQILVFTSIYLFKLFSENEAHHFSFLPGGILIAVISILSYYTNQNQLRQQYKLRFLDNQWEQIFLSLITEQYLIFDYDEEDYSFSYRNQQLIFQEITSTLTLREFLRKTTLSLKIKQNLEQFFHEELQHNSKKQNIVKQQLQLNLESGKQFNINYSIFYGMKPILILQQINRDLNLHLHQSIEIEQTFQFKYKFFIQAAYHMLQQHRAKPSNYYFNLIKLKRYCLYSTLSEKLIAQVDNRQSFNSCEICIHKLLNKIRSLYPEKKITIQYQNCTKAIQSNWQLLTTIIVGIIEKALTYRLEVRVTQIDESFIEFMFLGYFNEKSFNQILNKSYLYQNIIPEMIITENCISLFIFQRFFLLCSIANLHPKLERRLVPDRGNQLKQSILYYHQYISNVKTVISVLSASILIFVS